MSVDGVLAASTVHAAMTIIQMLLQPGMVGSHGAESNDTKPKSADREAVGIDVRISASTVHAAARIIEM